MRECQNDYLTKSDIYNMLLRVLQCPTVLKFKHSNLLLLRVSQCPIILTFRQAYLGNQTSFSMHFLHDLISFWASKIYSCLNIRRQNL